MENESIKLNLKIIKYKTIKSGIKDYMLYILSKNNQIKSTANDVGRNRVQLKKKADLLPRKQPSPLQIKRNKSTKSNRIVVVTSPK